MSAIEQQQANGLGDSPAHRDTPDPVQNGSSPAAVEEADDDDLFGDDNGAEPATQPIRRMLDDKDLDSGDDDGRKDRVQDTIEDEDLQEEPRESRMVDADVPRVKYPEGDEFYLLSMPAFLGLKHRNFDPANYEPPEKPHDGTDLSENPGMKFSPYSTAMSTMYWRRDVKNPEKLQSNARVIRWSDGSLTLQLATKPQEQYRIATTALRQHFGQKSVAHTSYDPSKDAHTYLAAPHGSEGIDLQLIHPIDAAMKILPSGDQADESIQRLERALAGAKEIHDPLARMKVVEEDPELAKRSAEMFEKDKARAVRKREAMEDRLVTRRDRVLGRSGLGGRSGGGGLSIAGLEDDEGMPSSRGTKKKGAMGRRTNRHGEIYSDDEDETLPRGRTREDEYDRNDDFLASSDEEPETYEDGEEPPMEDGDEDDDPDRDDLVIEGRQTVLKSRSRSQRDSPPKRARMTEIEDEEDLDAEGDEDTELARRNDQATRKKRRVIDDDEEEDD